MIISPLHFPILDKILVDVNATGEQILQKAKQARPEMRHMRGEDSIPCQQDVFLHVPYSRLQLR